MFDFSKMITNNNAIADKDKDIEIEIDRISAFFKNQNGKDLLMPLIQNAAYLKVMLGILQLTMDMYDKEYQTYNNKERKGAQQAYNQMLKNYTMVMKTLFEMLPAASDNVDGVVENSQNIDDI